jgi:hypothetical protein
MNNKLNGSMVLANIVVLALLITASVAAYRVATCTESANYESKLATWLTTAPLDPTVPNTAANFVHDGERATLEKRASCAKDRERVNDNMKIVKGVCVGGAALSGCVLLYNGFVAVKNYKANSAAKAGW